MLNKQTMISIEDALPGREASMQIDDAHFVNQSSLTAQPQSHQQQILFGMGCFWGAERLFGNLKASYQHPSATQVATRKIPLTMKFVRAKLAIPKWFASYSTSALFLWSNYWQRFGKDTTLRKECAKVTI